MSINELIAKVVKAYPRGELSDYWNYWNYGKCQPLKISGPEKSLAYYIICEIHRTYDADASDEKQTEQVCNIIDNAILTLEEFERALIHKEAIEARKNDHK